MAKPHQLFHLTALVLLFSLLISHSSLSSARPLQDYLPQSSAAAAFSIALPSEKVNKTVEKDNTGGKVPCDHHTAKANLDIRSSVSSPKIAGKYRPLALNILPKGTVPPSGPSKGTNDVKN